MTDNSGTWQDLEQGLRRIPFIDEVNVRKWETVLEIANGAAPRTTDHWSEVPIENDRADKNIAVTVGEKTITVHWDYNVGSITVPTISEALNAVATRAAQKNWLRPACDL